MNKKIISAILAAMMVIPTLAACGGKDGGVIGGADGTTGVEISDPVEVKDESKPEGAEVPEEKEQVTPTFMYFVSAQDKDYDAAMQTVSELQEQYGEQINFQITNIDENPEAAENFPVAGQTPALIMLNISNDISAIEFQTSDKATLENDIKAALGK